MIWRSIFLIGTMSVLVVTSQNCARADFWTTGPSTSSSTPATTIRANNGTPYDGKIYAEARVCDDGTSISARIILISDSQASLVRDNCRNLDPSLLLSSNDFSLSAPTANQLSYGNRTFTAERPDQPLAFLTPWYIQLQGALKATSSPLIDVDLFNTTSASMSSAKGAGHRMICNISAGTKEDFRSDAGSFQAADSGSAVAGTTDEHWLDTRSPNVRRIMLARIDQAKAKGCEILDFDSVDGYANNSGFALTSATQLDYNRFLALAAHDRKLQVALRGATQLIPSLVTYFDLAIAEQCFQNSECANYAAFTDAGKVVLAVEYTNLSTSQCTLARSLSISLAFTNSALDGQRFDACP